MKLFLTFFLLPVCLFAEIGYVEPWGRDAGLKVPTQSPPVKDSILVKMAAGIIHFHQNIISPVDGPRSHFRPSSSQYMLLSMQKHGFTKGFLMGCDRLMRENEDAWVYQTIYEDGKLFKYDPPK